PPPSGGSGVAPPTGETPGNRQSITAYTRRGLLGATAMPVRPMPSLGKPVVSCFHVSPPSVDLKIPPPGPLVGEYVYHGGRRAFHKPAYTIFEFAGSITTSTA